MAVLYPFISEHVAVPVYTASGCPAEMGRETDRSFIGRALERRPADNAGARRVGIEGEGQAEAQHLDGVADPVSPEDRRIRTGLCMHGEAAGLSIS